LVKLYDILEQKEKEQVDIENELDFLLSQQKELEDCLVPLEQELQSAEVLSSLNNEREPMYVVKSYWYYYYFLVIFNQIIFYIDIKQLKKSITK